MIWITLILILVGLVFWIFRRVTDESPDDATDMELGDFVRDNDDWVVLDTETTRLGPKAEVLEISIVDKAGKVLLDTLVKPKGSISAESKAVHGIDRKMVAEASTWPHIAAKFEGIVNNRAVFAYNAKFDFGVIEQIYDRWGLHPAGLKNVQGLCAMLAYADHRGGSRWHKLKDACEHEGVDFPEQHRALADAEATRRLILAMASGRGAVKKKPASKSIPIEMSIDYCDARGLETHRKIRADSYYTNPKGEAVLRAWCYEKLDVRHFKLDNIKKASGPEGVISRAKILSQLNEE